MRGRYLLAVIFAAAITWALPPFWQSTPASTQATSELNGLKATVEDLDSRLERQRRELQSLQELVAKTAPAMGKLRQDVTTAQKSAFDRIDELVPVGAILPYYGKLDSLPPNWVLCDGRDSPGLPYPWTKVPDLRRRFLRGAQDGGGETELGRGGGQDTIPNHYHIVTGSSNDVAFPRQSVSSWIGGYHPNTAASEGAWDESQVLLAIPANSTGVADGHGHSGGSATFRGESDRDGGHDNRPAFTSVYFIVRVK